ncbi:MAG TPA: YdeI/OmpD-associated family protein [Dehalococcoidia bacterium]|nr:YdeI/OmpD-associated family protein [Dehalococcoidia bacterium]
MVRERSPRNLKRPLQPMPDDVRLALEQRGLVAAYEARPAYQRNDYLGWIALAKRPETRAKRIDQMLDELARGGVYMNMPHRPSA